MNGVEDSASSGEASGEGGGTSATPPGFLDEARAIFRAWEKLRLLFNAILIVESGLGLAGLAGVVYSWPSVIAFGAFAALGANLCFILGPASETYLLWLGWRWRPTRPVLFTAGTIFSMAVTWFALGAYAMHHMWDAM